MAKLKARIVIEKIVELEDVEDLELVDQPLTTGGASPSQVAENEDAVLEARENAGKEAEELAQDMVGTDGIENAYVMEVFES